MSRPQELGRMLGELERAREIAVDTEADSFFNYREQVCLIQISADEHDWLVDPLAGLDLTPLGDVFADPARLKVFHDGEYDVLMLKRSFRFRFANLFDTRIAASALGDPAPGLAAVLKNHFGLELDKSMQRSDWSQRPLRPEQLAYARMDTHFLVRLMSLQVQALRERDRLFIVEGECRRLEQLEPPPWSFDPNEFARIKGARNLDALGKRSLRELFVERERLAEEANLPPFKVLHNDVLLDIAARRPSDLEQLGRLRGFTPRQLKRVGPSVLAALERARAAGPLERLPQLPRRDGTEGLTEAEFELHERLKEWRTERAKREGFDAALVLNRHVLVRLAQHKPRHLEELERIEGLQPWQAQRYGPELCAFVARTLEEFAREGLPGRPRRR